MAALEKGISGMMDALVRTLYSNHSTVAWKLSSDCPKSSA
jgi:hypothetical protein